ncbi:MAG: dATP/dGTP diphosphohydrolase domain-containing protein [Armatimonadia bacterium]
MNGKMVIGAAVPSQVPDARMEMKLDRACGVPLDPGVGKKYDAGKDRWDLLPLGPVEDVVKILTFGAQKYGPNNWQKLEDAENRYFAAALRHLAAWRRGEKCDPESGLPHLAHAMCNLTFLAWKDKEGQA